MTAITTTSIDNQQQVKNCLKKSPCPATAGAHQRCAGYLQDRERQDDTGSEPSVSGGGGGRHRLHLPAPGEGQAAAVRRVYPRHLRRKCGLRQRAAGAEVRAEIFG